MRSAWKLSSVAKLPRRRSGRAAVAAWMRPTRSPTAAAVAGPRGRRAARVFHRRCCSGGRQAMANRPRLRVVGDRRGHRSGRDAAPRTAASPIRSALRATGAFHSAATLQLGQRALDAQRAGPAGRRARCPTRRRRPAAVQLAVLAGGGEPAAARRKSATRSGSGAVTRPRRPRGAGPWQAGPPRCAAAGCTWPGARSCAREPILICPAGDADREIGEEVVLGLARARRDRPCA